MSIEIPTDLSSALIQWIRENNPKGHEDTAADLKSALCDLVDDNTISRRIIEKRLVAHLSSYDVRFHRSSYIEISDNEVTLRVTGPDREGEIEINSSTFDSSSELSRLAEAAEEVENSVWDDDDGEELINKWFQLED